MSKFKSGKALIGKLGIRNFEFFNDYIKKGLQPYTYLGRPIPPPDLSLKISHLKSQLKDAESRLHEIEFDMAPGKLEAEQARRQKIWNNQLPPIHGTRPSFLTDEDLARIRKGLPKKKETVKASIKTLTKKLASIKDFSWKDYSLTESAKWAEEILNDLIGYLYIEEEFLRINRLIKGPPQKTVTSSAEQEKAIFPCSPGTKWEDITMTLTANDMLRIKTLQGEGLFTYHKLEMEDKRAGDKPTVLWALLKLFAEKRGFISSQNINYDPKLPDTAKRLNKHLKGLFRIKDSIYQEHYKKEKGYRIRFKFSDVRHSINNIELTKEDESSQTVKDIFREADTTMKQIGASRRKRL